jgi:integrase
MAWTTRDPELNNSAPRKINDLSIAAVKYSSIGWHTFRHTYRSWLDENGAPMKMPQKLMRHASIQTTMNVYGQAMSSSKMRGEWEGCGDGAQADESERLKP